MEKTFQEEQLVRQRRTGQELKAARAISSELCSVCIVLEADKEVLFAVADALLIPKALLKELDDVGLKPIGGG